MCPCVVKLCCFVDDWPTGRRASGLWAFDLSPFGLRQHMQVRQGYIFIYIYFFF